jgi:phytanoyl-CoA hydroxylase
MSTPAVDVKSQSDSTPQLFAPAEIQQFQRDGYVIARGLAEETLRQEMWHATLEGLGREIGPLEHESDLQYPGAPLSRQTEGGQTVRRLKHAHARHSAFTQLVMLPELVGRLRQLLGPEIVVSLAHHNCIMTKQPSFSSDTGWHQDIRYWSFARPELVSVWLALGKENPENGCLKLIPGTHRIELERDRLDDDLFLRLDLPENQQLIASHVHAELSPGDVLFFHCRTFHSATRNCSAEPKFSVVFTFRPAEAAPLPGTRSASLPELLIPPLGE